MQVRVRPHTLTPPGRRPSDDTGVSPVVGMIMVLGISVVGIVGILYWGLPAIDEMKANVEFRSVQNQFKDLDATIKELVAGTTEKTAKRWQPTLNRGALAVANNTEPWLFATETYNASMDLGLFYGGLDDGDHVFTIKSNTTLTWVKVEASIMTGSSTSETLNVSLPSLSPTGKQMVGGDLLAWSAGDEVTFVVYRRNADPAAPYDLEKGIFHFRIYSGSSLVAEAFYMPTGRIEFDLSGGLGHKGVVENNGAVLAGTDYTYTIVSAPSIPPPATTGGTPRFFSRAFVLQGDVSFAGGDQFNVLISLNTTSTLASYDCATVSTSTCTESSRIFIYGDYQTPWHAYLTNADKGYRFSEQSVTVAGQTLNYLDDRRDHMGYTLLVSSIMLR